MVDELSATGLAWSTLLAHWLDFARSSVAIPDDAEGDRWRASVAAIINLQAVTFALAELDRVDAADRPFACDRASVLIQENAVVLESAWRGVSMPETLLEIGADARAALAASAYAGCVELVWEGDGVLVMPMVPVAGPGADERGTLAVAQPGTLLMPGEPVAWWVNRDGAPIVAAVPGATERTGGVPRQVYRQVGADGRIERDVVASILDDPPPGLPLLVPLYEDGRAIGHFTLEAETWEGQQRAAMAGERVPVEGS